MNKPTPDVQDDEEALTDARVARSSRALRMAMHDLLYEQAFDTITVQHIIERAGVSRGTFYAHYRNKNDALLASFEGMFGSMVAHLDAAPRDRRLVPVQELLSHFHDAQPVMASLRAAGTLDGILEYGVDLLADCIERRLPRIGARPSLPPRLAARMLAGALLEMMLWWLDHPERSTPPILDREFHTMAQRMLVTTA
ncbi:MAG: TetR/AcrR family transcriptional regulator [Gemmatimonadaceae bacterium]|nr:TetR/AcrR family transcriptional regulator [Gemmatimonadaceae bacterium]